MYTGPIKDATAFFTACGFPVPKMTNPPDHFLDVVNSSFQASTENSDKCSSRFQSVCLPAIEKETSELIARGDKANRVNLKPIGFFHSLWVLLQRNFLNNLRNPAVFLIRIVMYTGLCFCLGTLYWDIGDSAHHVQDRISILFFVAAFLTFMSISGMPAFVEERSLFIRERVNNHYTPLAYTIANFLSSLPWIFMISLLSSMLIHLMIQSRPGGDKFGIYRERSLTVGL